MTGVVKSLNERGFGFVTATDGVDYFFHKTNLSDPVLFEELATGDQMEITELANTEKGWRAIRLIPTREAT